MDKYIAKTKRAPSPRIETPILIWGHHAFALWLRDAIREWGGDFAGFVSDNAQDDFDGSPVYSPAQIQEMGLGHVPIIIAMERIIDAGNMPNSTQEHQRQFRLNISRITASYGLANPLLHPAALGDLFHFDWSGGTITFGMQGSGNTIYSHIIQQIKLDHPLRTYQSMAAPSRFIRMMRQEYMWIIQDLLEQTSGILGASECSFRPTHVGETKAYIRFTDQALLEVNCIPARAEEYSMVYGYHRMPDIPRLQELKKEGWQLMFFKRDLMDVLYSDLNKHDILDFEHRKDVCIDKLFHWLIPKNIDELNAWRERLPELNVYTYESLLENPEATIQALAEDIGVSLSEKKASEYWERFGFRSLPGAPKGHYHKAKIGRWKEKLSETHKRVFKAMNMEKLLREYGYGGTADELADILTSVDISNVSIQEMRQPVLDSYTGKIGLVEFETNDPAILESAIELFGAPYMQAILHAGNGVRIQQQAQRKAA